MKGNLFRIAKQLVRNNKDVDGSGCEKGRYDNSAVDDSRIKQVWKEYFEKLLMKNLSGTRTSWKMLARPVAQLSE